MDKELWKIERLIKDEDDMQMCINILSTNMNLLINIFKTIISQSNYPQISWNDFTLFGNQLNLFDTQFGLSTFDRLFITTNVSSKTDDNSGQELRRFEFFEILIRIANAKFKEQNLC